MRKRTIGMLTAFLLSAICTACSFTEKTDTDEIESKRDRAESMESSSVHSKASETERNSETGSNSDTGVRLSNKCFRITDPDENDLISEEQILTTEIYPDNADSMYQVELVLTDEGREILSQYTQENVGERLTIWYEEQIIQISTIVTPIQGGELRIANIDSKSANEMMDAYSVKEEEHSNGYIRFEN